MALGVSGLGISEDYTIAKRLLAVCELDIHLLRLSKSYLIILLGSHVAIGGNAITIASPIT